MVTLKGAFNAEEHRRQFTLIAPGKYTAMVIDSEYFSNEREEGITLKFRIQGGEYDNVVFTQNYAVYRASSDKRKSASSGNFALICDACKQPLLRDTAMLHNIPIGLQITNNENTGTDGVTRKFNNIANAWSLDGTNPPRTANGNSEPAPQQTQQTQPQEPDPYYGNRPPFMQQQPDPQPQQKDDDVPF